MLTSERNDVIESIIAHLVGEKCVNLMKYSLSCELARVQIEYITVL